MAHYFNIKMQGGNTRVVATTDEVAKELHSLSAQLRSYGSCPCNKAAKQQTKAKMQSLLLGAGAVKCPPELMPASFDVAQLPETWDLPND